MHESITTSFDWETESLVRSGAEHRTDEGRAVLLPEIDHYFASGHNETLSQTRTLNTSRRWALEQMMLRRMHPNWGGRAVADWPLIEKAVLLATSNARDGTERFEETWFPTIPDASRIFEALPVEYRDRAAELEKISEEEGIRPDPQSLEHFARFVESQGFPLRVGALFLLDNGTYAAVWRNDQWRLNLTFHNDGSMEYVLLDRKAGKPYGKIGRVDLDSFFDLRDRLELELLLRA